MEKIKVKEILKTAKGRLIQGSENISFVNISIDTRTLKKGDLFIALKGKNFDGHNFILEAIKKGAKGIIKCSGRIYPTSSGAIYRTKLPVIIEVKDTLKALQNIANFYRKKFDIPIIAITGSNGKTTTKEMLWNILSKKAPTLKNKGNYNNEIGLPLTLFELDRHYKFAVLELGTNAPGEIKRLAEIAEPTVGVITNIGLGHTEGLLNIDGVAKEKLSLLEGLKGNRVVVLNVDNEILHKFLSNVKNKNLKIITYGIKNKADVLASDIEDLKEHGIKFIAHFKENSGKLKELKIFLPLAGMHNVYNTLAAISVANTLGVEPINIKKGLQNIKNLPMRMEIKRFNGITIINDSYNANPQSVRELISIVQKWDAKRKILVLGDMLELGKLAVDSHKKLADIAIKGGIDILFTIGTLSAITAEQFKKKDGTAFIYNDKDKMTKDILKIIRKGDLILIKGSRAMKMEGVARKIITPFTLTLSSEGRGKR